MGLAHRGFRLNDYRHHLVHTLREAGYWSGLVGEQHLSSTRRSWATTPSATSTRRMWRASCRPPSSCSRSARRTPVLPLGGLLRDPPRVLRVLLGARRALLARRRRTSPTPREVRRDMASFKQSARSLDQGVGAVLNALDEHDVADDTLVVLTTDHGLPFPGAKASLLDRGIGVLLIIRGPGGFHGGRVTDALVSQIDIYPTLCELAGVEPPPFVQGRSLLPVVRREVPEINDEIFAELTYHAAYDPQRAIRTRRHKYVRLFGDRLRARCCPTSTTGRRRTCSSRRAGGTRPRAAGAPLRPSVRPDGGGQPGRRPGLRRRAGDLRARLEAWMRATDDPLLLGPVPAPAGAELNDPAGRLGGRLAESRAGGAVGRRWGGRGARSRRLPVRRRALRGARPAARRRAVPLQPLPAHARPRRAYTACARGTWRSGPRRRCAGTRTATGSGGSAPHAARACSGAPRGAHRLDRRRDARRADGAAHRGADLHGLPRRLLRAARGRGERFAGRLPERFGAT